MAKEKEIPTTKVRKVFSGNLRNFFMFFTILGAASIYFVRIVTLNSLFFQMAVPSLVVIFYAIFIFNKGKNVLNQDQLGDSVYYLGFLITLIALIFALFDMSKDLSAEVIIPKFAIALVTTVVGIFIRIYASQFAPSQEDINEMSEKMLGKRFLHEETIFFLQFFFVSS